MISILYCLLIRRKRGGSCRLSTEKVQRPDLQSSGFPCQFGVMPQAQIFLVTSTTFILGRQKFQPPFSISIVSETQIYTKCERKKICDHCRQKPGASLAAWLVYLVGESGGVMLIKELRQ